MRAQGLRAQATDHAIRPHLHLAGLVVYGGYEKSPGPAAGQRDMETDWADAA